jgi:hypothetical protein
VIDASHVAIMAASGLSKIKVHYVELTMVMPLPSTMSNGPR